MSNVVAFPGRETPAATPDVWPGHCGAGHQDSPCIRDAGHTFDHMNIYGWHWSTRTEIRPGRREVER